MDQQQSAPEKVGPRDVFLHLLAIVTLYASAITFSVLIFDYIDIYIPDPLIDNNYYSVSSSYQSIRWSIASLIVIFPVYLLTTRHLNRSYSGDPARSNLRTRRWLLYFTLLVATLIIIGDLVTLIYRLLGGELTIRFALKMLAVLFVAGSIFGYYRAELKKYK
ncbi:MAG: DUF5671 domain-containing protein [Candidatus Doudnabacteria bacterium]|nr:DUF5671 domain-containing protein [bacterium]MDZ4243650.1 DUF5671 domain-containing protein [Candidatus Doudnabacteria bacterium]